MQLKHIKNFISYKPIVVFMAILLFSCRQRSETEIFYTDDTDWDCARIPFVKPYEALNLNGSKKWCMNSVEDVSLFADSIQKANIIDHKILLYCFGGYRNGERFKEMWFVFMPWKHLEKGFIDHNEYVKYLHQIGLKTEPPLYDVKLIWNYFEKHYPVNWETLNKTNCIP